MSLIGLPSGSGERPIAVNPIKQYAIRTIINVGFGPFFSASIPNKTVEGIATRLAIKNKAALIVAGSLSTWEPYAPEIEAIVFTPS